MQINIENKLAIVTDSTAGIGYAIARLEDKIESTSLIKRFETVEAALSVPSSNADHLRGIFQRAAGFIPAESLVAPSQLNCRARDTILMAAQRI